MTETKKDSIAPAAICALTAAVFVALAGAFLVGALLIVSPQLFTPAGVEFPEEPKRAAAPLLYAIYGAAGFCFAVALGALFLGAKKVP